MAGPFLRGAHLIVSPELFKCRNLPPLVLLPRGERSVRTTDTLLPWRLLVCYWHVKRPNEYIASSYTRSVKQFQDNLRALSILSRSNSQLCEINCRKNGRPIALRMQIYCYHNVNANTLLFLREPHSFPGMIRKNCRSKDQLKTVHAWSLDEEQSLAICFPGRLGILSS